MDQGTLAPAVVHWSLDGWKTLQDTETRETGLGLYIADLPAESLPAGSAIFNLQADTPN